MFEGAKIRIMPEGHAAKDIVVGIGTIDESPKAYKDTEEILKLISDTVEVEYFILPVINMKATNSYDSTMEIDMNEEAD